MIEGAPPHYKTIPCRHWLRGDCKLGASCNFRHGENDENATLPMRACYREMPQQMRLNESMPSIKTGTKPCRHFQRGYCERGDMCNFAHVKGNIGDPFPPCVRALPPGRRKAWISPPGAPLMGTQYPSLMTAGLKSRPCRHFKRGFCERGLNCGFLHEERPASQDGFLFQQGGPTPCRHFLRGRCDLGAQCKFGHIPALFGSQRDTSEYQRLAKRGTRLCRHYAKGFCSLGEQCDFAHGDPKAFGDIKTGDNGISDSSGGDTASGGLKRKRVISSVESTMAEPSSKRNKV